LVILPELVGRFIIKLSYLDKQADNLFLFKTLFLFFLGGAFTAGQAAQRAPPKTTGLPLAGPDQARSLRLSPSRSTACRRDPCRHRTQHPSCYLRQAPRRRQTHWRVTSNWPPSPCPLHGATRPLPTPVEHISAYQGGPAFAPATPQPPSAAACGTSAPRLPPRGFR